MKTGNAAEQLEAAMVESLIAGYCDVVEAVEVSREFSVGADGELIVDVKIVQKLAADKIVIDFTL